MTENILLSCLVICVNVFIQCMVVSFLIDILVDLEKRKLIRTSLLGSSALLISVMLILFIGNLIQMAIWAGLFEYFGEFSDFRTAFYHSVVNFTTLGYGDVVMSDARRLLGAFEGANGIMMFGLSTGLVFAVLNMLIKRELVKWTAN